MRSQYEKSMWSYGARRDKLCLSMFMSGGWDLIALKDFPFFKDAVKSFQIFKFIHRGFLPPYVLKTAIHLNLHILIRSHSPLKVALPESLPSQ